MKFSEGDRVQLSGRHLAFTGQRKGPEGAKVWSVRACACSMCASGDFVCTDEVSSYTNYTEAERAADPGLQWRHVAAGNLVRYGKPSLRNEVPVIGKLPLGYEHDPRPR